MSTEAKDTNTEPEVRKRRRMKVYTGGGDRGKTSLFSGERVRKNHARIEAVGAVDELNSVLGLVASALPPEEPGPAEEIREIQAQLLNVGAWLATSPGAPTQSYLQEITLEHSQELEKAIDRMEETLPPLKAFILPGGHTSAAWAQLARSVCRRAERRTVALTVTSEDVLPEQLWGVLMFINRLSDYLFVLARYLNRFHNEEEYTWKR